VRIDYRGLAEPSAPVAPAEARNWAAQNRADLLAALADYAATQAALQGEIARQYPDFSIGPGYQLDQGEGKWSLGLNLTLPVFNQNQGPIAAAQARREASGLRFIALQARVLAEVDRAAADYASALGDLETVKTMRTNLTQQAKTVRAQQKAGEISRLELAQAQIELADNSRAELEARVRSELALGAFEDAVQRPLAWPEPTWRDSTRTATP
jgi:cobalt-zinc-cadmium efflux system outer membrane protein